MYDIKAFPFADSKAMKSMSKKAQVAANGGYKYYKIHCNGCGKDICGGTKWAAEFMNGIHVASRKNCYGTSVYIGWC